MFPPCNPPMAMLGSPSSDRNVQYQSQIKYIQRSTGMAMAFNQKEANL